MRIGLEGNLVRAFLDVAEEVLYSVEYMFYFYFVKSNGGAKNGSVKSRTHDLQERIYSFILTYQQDKGKPTTNREIGREVGITSTNLVAYHLAQLEQRGLITRHPQVSRRIESA